LCGNCHDRLPIQRLAKSEIAPFCAQGKSKPGMSGMLHVMLAAAYLL